MIKNPKIFFNPAKFSLVLFISVFLTIFSSESKASPVEKGQTIFEQMCSRCHTIGGGLKIGPDLQGITERREKNWLLNWISNPEKAIKSGDPIANELIRKYNIQMPSHGLSKDEVSALLSYLESPKPLALLKEEKKGIETSFVSNTYLLYSENVQEKKFAPFYEYIELDIKDKERKLSFHSAGWLGYDLRAVRTEDERERDELTYAYLSYEPLDNKSLTFNLGRHFIFGGVASEQIDGMSAKWEIIPSTGVSIYGGVPIETEKDGRRSDSIYGGRLFQRINKKAEVGISYLKEHNDSNSYREETGLDVWGFPLQWLEFQGQSFYNNATDGWLEHSYNLRIYPIKKLILSTFVSHADYHDAFSATTLSAFSPDSFGSNEKMTKIGGSVEYELGNKITLVADYTNYDYKILNTANYFGASLATTSYGIKTGVSLHRMEGSEDKLRYLEARAYAVKSCAGLKMALDIINVHYDKAINNLSNAYSFNGTLSYRFTKYLSGALNLDYGKNPDFTHELKGFIKLALAFNKIV